MANKVLVGEGPHRNTLQRVSRQSSQRSGAEYRYTLRIYQITKKLPMPQSSRRGQTKMQAEWTASKKAAANKQYFPSVQDRLRTKLTLTAKLAAVLTGHEKTRAYLYRFKLRDDARCICGHNETNHGSSPIPLREDQHTARGPKTPNKSTTKLDGN